MDHLISIRIKGFKSFLREQSIDFSKEFNCIVGKNGTGKSSILEAIAFVLNLNKKISKEQLNNFVCNLIHKDQRAEISLLFSSQKNITLSAEIFAGKTPSYIFKINGKIKSRAEMKKFLFENGIDVRNPLFYIRQNTITEILNQKPKELVSAIFQASGTQYFFDNVELTNNELEKWERKAQEIQENISLFEDSLRKDQEKILKFERKKDLDFQIPNLKFSVLSFKMQNVQSLIFNLKNEKINNELETQKIIQKLEKLQNSKEKTQKSLHFHFQRLENEKNHNNQQILEKIQEKTKEESNQQEKLNLYQTNYKKSLNWEKDNSQALLLNNQQIQNIQSKIASRKGIIQSVLEKKIRTENELSKLQLEKNQGISLFQKQSSLNEEMISLQKELSILIQKEKILKDENNSIKNILSSQKENSENILKQQISHSKEKVEMFNEKLISEDAKNNEIQLQSILKQKKDLTTQITHLEKSISQMSLDESHFQNWMLNSYHKSQHFFPIQIEKIGFVYGTVLSLFELKKEAQKYLTALNSIVSSKIFCVCTENISVANFILDKAHQNHKNIRIWSLDRIKFHYSKQFQNFLQEYHSKKQWNEEDVIIPLDLITIQDDKFLQIVRKCFGEVVISRNDEIAKKLISQYQISSATLSGDIHRKGMLSGGYLQKKSNPFLEKFKKLQKIQQMKEIEKELLNLENESRLLLKSQENLTKIQLEKKKEQNRLNELTRNLEEKQRRYTNLKRELGENEEELSKLSHKIQSLMEFEKLKRDQLSQIESLKNHNSSNFLFDPEMIGHLESQINHFLKEIQEMKKIQREEKKTIKELIVQQKIIQEERKEIGDPSKMKLNIREIQIQIGKTQQELEELQKNHEEKLKELKLFEEKINQKREKEKKLNVDIETSCKLKKELSEKNERNEEKINLLLMDEKKLKKKIEEMAQNNKQINKEKIFEIETETDFQKASLNLKKMKNERETLEKFHFQIQDRLLIENRKLQISEFKEKHQNIQKSILILKEGMDSSKEKVEKVNKIAFSSIKKKFSQIFQSLVSSKEVEIRIVDDSSILENGICFWTRNQNSDWKEGLSELSGGEKSCLALAFIFAVARYKKPVFYILDESDSALDDLLSSKVAKLLKNSKDQIIAVSHHQCFQIEASRSIQLSKEKGYSEVIRIMDRLEQFN
ncbi:structural maintenance of chromosomes protein [Anaeramoeba ignava]|uniref:Structural maintenance of chromosomes protein n=1 Tax=Anaeramoeba ignava TaxID=1746090 RepID=A0A9Q0L9M9_ANAIG|nr:structural maintenance of chromosomes protein [Anaeramoeba ignava]